ncbi:hypothetical protein H7992_07085 [Sporosarcina sp. resist]|uniref:hypothetical protein n=1 Tax=Sporosarcina sp. resist TaxID=2762563 RepID=UPI00164DAE55|nr:hypothetical protein [Sporosarcina sp. resist]QNK90796.1 hypothetical protein H7992_07085 [Sporosarcina sp. resist]
MKSLQTEQVEIGVSDACTGEVDKKSTTAKGKPKEQLSDRDWREMMGQNRQTYKRVNGAIRKR